MSDLYNGKWLRRWSLNSAGQLECAEDAVNVELISTETRQAIETRNAGLHQAISDEESLRLAYLVPEPGEDVTRTMRVYEESTFDPETGEEELHWHMEPRPEWVAWGAAQELIAGASEEILAVRRIRMGEPDEGDLELVDETWNTPIEVEIWEELPDLNSAQFWGVVYATGNEVEIAAYIDQVALVDPVTAGLIRGRVERSGAYRRYDPLTVEMQSWRGMSDQEFNGLWQWAAAS
jgi:hypothetical protein